MKTCLLEHAAVNGVVLRGYLEVRIDNAAVRDLHKSFYQREPAEYFASHHNGNFSWSCSPTFKLT
jgi:hypothetical protein